MLREGSGSALAFPAFSSALVSSQGPQGEPGPPGQQGNPGAQVRGKLIFQWVGKRNDSFEQASLPRGEVEQQYGDLLGIGMMMHF